MKHARFASSCNASARSTMAVSVTLTSGCSTISVNRPLPAASSVITAVG